MGTEAEYVAMFDVAKEALWLGQLPCKFQQANPKCVANSGSVFSTRIIKDRFVILLLCLPMMNEGKM